jgi:hypothetical protein
VYKNCIECVKERLLQELPVVIIATKKDLEVQREVSTEEGACRNLSNTIYSLPQTVCSTGKELAGSLGVLFFEVCDNSPLRIFC